MTDGSSLSSPINNPVVITSYFNPQHYNRPRANFRRFAEGIAAAGVPLWIVELAFDDDPFELPSGTTVLSLRGSRARHLMWQKERLLNLLIERLPADVDAIAWIDADVVFLNPYWVNELKLALGRLQVVQLFESASELLPDGSISSEVMRSTASGTPNRLVLPIHRSKSHPGMAWAARASLLKRHGLLDTMISGSGDLVMLRAWSGVPYRLLTDLAGRLFSTGWAASNERWAAPVAADVAGAWGSVPGSIVHLFHGRAQDRAYAPTWTVLDRHDYQPDLDLIREANGLWGWSDAACSNKPAMVAAVAQQFARRREDD